MRIQLTWITCFVLLVSSRAVMAGQPYLVSEELTGSLWRIQDVNNDGDALDVGERTLWGTGLEQAVGLESFGGAIYAANVYSPVGGDPHDEIWKLFDANGDGDALDAGESIIWASGLNQPVDLVPDGTGGFYVSQLLANNVLHLVDSNNDGDALDVGEQTTFADSFNGPADLIAWGEGLLVSSTIDDDVFFLVDTNSDGDALDTAEKSMLLADVGESFGLLADSSGGLYISSFNDDTIYRATDQNADGDFLDIAEVLVYADDVYGGLNDPWDLTAYAAGGFLLADRDDMEVLWVRDVNGDGDALDLGEVTVFADGINGGPVDIVALPVLVSDADFDSDGDVDGFDFLTWQRGYSLTAQIDNSHGDANFDGTVNGGDLDVWETQYGNTPPLAATVSVPEPGGTALVMLAALLVIRRGERRDGYL